MKVLVSTPWMPPAGGGLERYAWEMARRIAQQGDSVTLLAHTREPLDEMREGVRCVGVKPSITLSHTPLSLEVHRVARKLLREGRTDVVNVHTPVPGTAEAVAYAARRAGVPWVVTYHAGELAGPKGILSLAARLHARTFERWMLRGAAERIAVSPYVAEHALRGLSARIVPPGVDTTRFDATDAPVPGRILFVGPVSRAYAWKGFKTLANAFEALQRHGPEAHLRVVGEGDLVETYRERFAGRAVAFLGRLDEAALVREYSRASVVVLPSTTPAESFGMVLAEANACARPVVASDIGGIPSFVHDGENGLLVPPGDTDALANALGRILADPTLARKLGAAGRARVLADHQWDALMERTLGTLVTAASVPAARSSSSSRVAKRARRGPGAS